MVNIELIVQLLLLLLVANGVPILARNLLEGHADWQIDGGCIAPDGRPLLGETKTWRGLVTAILFTSLIAKLLGYSFTAGALLAFYSLLGDVLSSFIKRRAGLPPSSRATGLDQLPEATLPLLLMHEYFALNLLTGVITVVGFTLLEIVLSKLLFYLHVRRRPY